jgi:hypothetical protein
MFIRLSPYILDRHPTVAAPGWGQAMGATLKSIQTQAAIGCFPYHDWWPG